MDPLKMYFLLKMGIPIAMVVYQRVSGSLAALFCYVWPGCRASMGTSPEYVENMVRLNGHHLRFVALQNKQTQGALQGVAPVPSSKRGYNL